MALVGRGLSKGAFRWVRAASGCVERTVDPSSWGVLVEAPNKRQTSQNGLHWVFMGCPGVGKGTYASKLASFLSIPHIAMGDLVRQELSQPSEASKKLFYAMSRGKLLPDEVVVSLLSKRLEMGALEGEKGFILDGFPRNTTQTGT